MTKTCNKCGKSKSLDAFRSNGEKGKRGRCKSCENSADRKKYHSDKSYKKKVQARHAVEDAVKRGDLKKPSKCSRCGGGGSLHAHHKKGYGKKSRTSISWVCASCNEKAKGR